MKRPADEVDLLGGRRPHAINEYLLADVLFDATTRRGERRSCAKSPGAG